MSLYIVFALSESQIQHLKQLAVNLDADVGHIKNQTRTLAGSGKDMLEISSSVSKSGQFQHVSGKLQCMERESCHITVLRHFGML